MKLSADQIVALAPTLGLDFTRAEAEGVARRLAVIADSVAEARTEQLVPHDAPFTVDRIEEDNSPPVGLAVQVGDQVQPSSASRELTALPITALSRLLQRRDVSPVELTEAYLERIARLDGPLNSFITVTPERARQDAVRAESEIMNGALRGAMHGIPVAHKDLLHTKGIRTTFNSEHFRDFVPDVDAAVVTNLANAGTVLLGKLNTYEFGNGVGDTFGPACNPWDVARDAGGSSSGSGSAVAADLVAGATGSDAAGSIRVPAAFCGVVGLKPTFGTIGRFPGSWNSASTVGPMAKTVRDAAIMLEWMVDAGSRHHYADLHERLHVDVRDLTIGVPRRWLDVPMAASVETAYWNAVEWFREAGAMVVDVDLPHAEWSQTIGSVITTVEGFAPLQPLLVQGARISTYVRQTILTSQLISANDMLLAKAARRLLIDEVSQAHRVADLIITPTVPYPAYRFDEIELSLERGTVNARANLTVYGRMANLTGFPAVSVPSGLTESGLPLAFQLMGRPFEESWLLGAAAAYEDATSWHDRRSRLTPS